MASSKSAEPGGPKASRWLEAVYVLAMDSLREAADDSERESTALAAVEDLRDAPLELHWSRGLMGGLRSSRRVVVEATVAALLERLGRCREARTRDELMAAILDACFLNLSGRPTRTGVHDEESRRAGAFELAAGQLIQAITRRLGDHPNSLEDHRSRLLSQARRIEHLPGRSFLARAVVDFQDRLAAGEAPSNRVAEDLLRFRQTDLFTSPQTSEATLLAYLERDRKMALEKVDQERFQVYRMLLGCQTKEQARSAILAAMDNLIHWLDQLPQDGQAREPLMGDVVNRARAGIPWPELDLRICRHLEAHLELLPGADHPEDLLRQLREKYDASAGEDILVRGLNLLRRLPLVRLRSRELCEFILSPGRVERSFEVWMAFLDLVASLLTGLADFVLTRDELTRREERRLRALRDFLAYDEALRSLLRRLATDSELALSTDSEVAARIREEAWRRLLRSLPHERLELYREGLLDHGHTFFFVTLEEGARAHQRELWPVLNEHWTALLGIELESQERRRRLDAVGRLFRQVRNFAGIQDQAGERAATGDAVRELRDGSERLGPMLSLAFDDSDDEVRRLAEEAVIDAGYALELERERQRRELLQLRDSLTTSNQRVIELEETLQELGRQATATQVQRAEHGLEVQSLLQLRDHLVTVGWLDTSELTVDLEEVRTQLQEAIAAGHQALERLHELQRRMYQEHAESQRIHSTIQNLVGQQEQLEAEAARLERQRERAQREQERAERERSGAASELQSRRGNPPARPRSTGDQERDRREQDAYSNRLARHQRELARLGNRIERLAGEITTHESQIRHCEAGIERANREWQRVQSEIDKTQSRIAAIRDRIRDLERRFSSQQRECEAIRREIARLRREVDSIEQRMNAVRERNRRDLGQNTVAIEHEQSALEEQYQRLQDLSRQLNSTGDDLDRQLTRSQRLVQDIESGRGNYDRVAEEAVPRSATADAEGTSRQQAHEYQVQAEQEVSVHYVEGMQRALRGRPMPPTRQQRRNKKVPARKLEKGE